MAGGARGGGTGWALPGPRLRLRAPPPQLAACESGSRGALRPASFPPPFGALRPRAPGAAACLRLGADRTPEPYCCVHGPSAGLGVRARARGSRDREQRCGVRVPTPSSLCHSASSGSRSSAPIGAGPSAPGAWDPRPRRRAAHLRGAAIQVRGVSALAVAYRGQAWRSRPRNPG